MILREVMLHNFGPYRGRTTIDLSPTDPSQPRPIVLVGALNGSGKTTLLDALQLALYGSRARCSTRKALPYPEFLRQSINTRAAPSDGAAVSVEFDFASARGTSRLRVVRTWRVAGKGVAEEARVYRDNTEDAELSETWAERVEDILPIGISNLFFFDGEQVRELAASSQATTEVRTAIRTLLGLELPQQLQTDLGVVVNRRRKALVSSPAARATLEDIEERVRQCERRRTEAVHQIAEVQVQYDRAQRALLAAQDRFSSGGGELAQRGPALKQEEETLKARQDHAQERLRELAAGALPLGLVNALLKRALARGREERDHLDGHQLAGLFQERDDGLLALLNRRGGPPDLIDVIRLHLTEDRSARQRPLATPPYLHASRESLTMSEAAWGEGQRQFSVAKDALTNLQRIENELTRVKAQREAAPSVEEVEGQLHQMSTLQREVTRLERDLEVLREARDVRAKEVAQLRTEHERTLRRLAEAESDTEDDARVVRAAERVTAVMEDFKRRLLYRKIHELEQLIVERFEHLARKPDFIRRVIVDPETFELRLFDGEGLSVLRDRMSAGEQQILAIAYLWALAIASGRNLPVVIDTPLGRMDHEHRRTLVERYFPHASHQVVLLSTDAEIDERYLSLLRDAGAIDREYTIQFDPKQRQSEVVQGYFLD